MRPREKYRGQPWHIFRFAVREESFLQSFDLLTHETNEFAELVACGNVVFRMLSGVVAISECMAGSPATRLVPGIENLWYEPTLLFREFSSVASVEDDLAWVCLWSMSLAGEEPHSNGSREQLEAALELNPFLSDSLTLYPMLTTFDDSYIICVLFWQWLQIRRHHLKNEQLDCLLLNARIINTFCRSLSYPSAYIPFSLDIGVILQGVLTLCYHEWCGK